MTLLPRRRDPGLDWDDTEPLARYRARTQHEALPPAVQPVIAVTVAVGDHAPPTTEHAARLQGALTYLRLKVAILTRRQRLDRISDEILAMIPALPNGHTAKTLVKEAADLLRTERDAWEPAPEPPIPWYRPELGDDGMPKPRHAVTS